MCSVTPTWAPPDNTFPLFQAGERVLGVFAMPRADVALLLLVSPFRGLFFTSPVLVASVAGIALLWRRDGRSFYTRYSARPLYSSGQHSGAVVAFSDMTERRELEKMKEEGKQSLLPCPAASEAVVVVAMQQDRAMEQTEAADFNVYLDSAFKDVGSADDLDGGAPPL